MIISGDTTATAITIDEDLTSTPLLLFALGAVAVIGPGRCATYMDVGGRGEPAG